MNKKEIDRLTTELNNLTIRQNSLANDILKAKKALQELIEPHPSRRNKVVKGSGLRQGDTVIILNPSRGQPNTGRVCGHTRDGLIKIQTQQGHIIRRLPKNLEKRNQHEHRK